MRELEFLEDAEVTILSDRRARGPWGLAGGEAGAPGLNRLIQNEHATEIPAKGPPRRSPRRDPAHRIPRRRGLGSGIHMTLSRTERFGLGLLLLIFTWFTWRGMTAFYSGDDMMNMYGAWMLNPWRLAKAQILFWMPVYRPLGAAIYRVFYAAVRLPSRAALHILLAAAGGQCGSGVPLLPCPLLHRCGSPAGRCP